jgi:hypothetical protein
MFWKKREKKEVKPLGTSVSWEDWTKSELPCCMDTHLLSVLNKDKELVTGVGKGLPDIDIILKDGVVYFIVHTIEHNCYLKDIKDPTQFMYCVSDDPSMEYAGDWTQLGCMRVFFVLNGPTFEFGKDYMLVSCPAKYFTIKPSYNEVGVDKVN